MTFLDELQQVSPFAVSMLVIGMVPLAIGLAYAVRPVERWLTLMRPASLAAIFAALASFLSTTKAVLLGVGATPNLTVRILNPIAIGASESLLPMMMVFTCLTLAWLLVAVGEFRALRRVA